MVKLSVIIPTHRRPEILRECLKHLESQTVASEIEVIVVGDGYDPKIPNSKFQIPISFLEIPKSQQGAARNEGVKHAQGEYVLFIGDDIFLEPNACEKHLATRTKSEIRNPKSEGRLNIRNSNLEFPSDFVLRASDVAILGFTTWDPDCGITPTMKWLETSGWQFGYPAISSYAHTAIPSSMQHRFTYTSHISLPFSIAKKLPFRTDVHLYGWEDIEWGMRLRDAGVRLVYEPDAKALHHHHIKLEDSLKRMETLGRSAVEIAQKVPTFDRVPRGWKLLAYKIFALFPTMAGKHRKAFLRGL